MVVTPLKLLIKIMISCKTLHTGTLPYYSGSKLAINIPPNEVLFFDLSLKEIHKIEGYQAIALSDHNVLLRNGRNLTFYSIENKEVNLDLKNIRVFPFQVDEKILLNYRKSPTLELRDFSTTDILWKSDLVANNRIIQGVCNQSVFIGNVLDSTLKICVDMKSGDTIWKCDANKLLKIKNTFAGNNNLFADILISQASSLDYFGVSITTGLPIWHLNLKNLFKMGKVISGSIMFIFVKELNDIYLLTIDLFKGSIIIKEILTEKLRILKIYPEDKEYFGQPSFYDNQLFFGSDNKLIKLDLSTYEMKIIYEHTAVFFFSKVVGSKLFYSDSNFQTLVFELDDTKQPLGNK